MPTPVSLTDTQTYSPGLRRRPAPTVSVRVSMVMRAAARHRVAGVDRQVEDRELELVGVDPRRRQVGRAGDIDLDRRPDRAGERSLIPLEQPADVDRARLQVLAAGEGEQALDQGRRAARGLERDVDQPVRSCLAGGNLAAQQVEVADDRGQQIVEVVGDPAGELAERLQLLRLVQLGERRLMLARCAPRPALRASRWPCADRSSLCCSASSRARASYCRRRPRSAERARLTRVVGWNGRSRKVTLPSISRKRPAPGLRSSPPPRAGQQDERQVRPFRLRV